MKLGGLYPDKRRIPHGWPACLRRQPPRVAFRNNVIYVIVHDEEYKELRERQPKVQYKLKLCDNPAALNMPHEEDYSDDNYESIDKTAQFNPLDPHDNLYITDNIVVVIVNLLYLLYLL